jgi:hypothetical protein
LHRLSGKIIVADFDESKPTGLATEAIAQDIHGVYLNARLIEKRL